ncbi:hypothetical protein CVT43_04430 [Enterococcus faecalis OG1RF]|nr:hypothetical protein CVT43_04430 [Enterococcus faecalis OG1RF]AZV96457.1 hypothetical protein CVT44_04430 [Enterococcus faecalis]ELA02912.1 putative membrane protein [Enterococcus faecalis OG1X]ELA04944.1 putative membrane protein [Enterococcus faecalis M7]PIO17427.1 hypothetical protein CE093_10415 [Enterococcus faecalis]
MAFKTLGIITLSSLNATSINLVICTFIKSESTLRTLNSILGAVSGFICTAYLPVGSFSGPTEKIIKFLPISYASSNFRRIFISPLLTKMPHAQEIIVKKYLGLGYSWNFHLTTATIDSSILIVTTIFCLFFLSLCSKKITQISMS